MTRMKVSLGVTALGTTVFACALVSERTRDTVDLSSPEATAVSFTRAAALGDVESALSCCLAGSHDHRDIKEALTAVSSPPGYQFRQMLEPIDIHAPIHIVCLEKDGDNAEVVWRVRFKRDFRITEGGGHIFKADSTFDLDGALRKSEDRWLIEGI